MNLKLQNILFPDSGYLDDNWWMFYRDSRMFYDDMDGSYNLDKHKTYDFFTYFNSFSLKKWKTYTALTNVTLNLRMQGRFRIRTFGHSRNGSIEKEHNDPMSFDLKEAADIRILFPEMKSTVISFVIDTMDEVKLYGGYYSTEVPDSCINRVDISLVTTTFKKEDYIKNNVKILNKRIFSGHEDLKNHLEVKVIDNGRTLDPADIDSEHIKLYPNPNTGGSGGFTRGMLETLEDKRAFTHILLMDDDVIILPESLIRTFSFLRLLKDEYKDRFISGAMLYYERMNVQHEDVGHLSGDGQYGPVKPGFELHLWESVLDNEEEMYPNYGNSYAGWWYCCIPMSKVKPDNLPLPVFIRGDDVEFSIANSAEFITMNGICVWHKGFTTKYNAALELYLVHRNSLAIQAISGLFPDVDFIERIKKFFWKEITRFNYQAADLLLDAVDDFMKGPAFYEKPDGEAIMKEKFKKNEIMTDLNKDFPELCSDIFMRKEPYVPLNRVKKLIYKGTFNGHLLPKFMLKKKVMPVHYDWTNMPGDQYMRSSLIAVNYTEHLGHLRHISRKEFLKLMRRFVKVMGNYSKNREKVEKMYREKAAYFKSSDFWKKYLEMGSL